MTVTHTPRRTITSWDSGDSWDSHEWAEPLSNNMLLLCEAYLTVVLVMQFSVLGVFLVGDISMLTPLLTVAGVVLIAAAPSNLRFSTKLNIPALVLISWCLVSGLWNANEGEWRRSLFRFGFLPIVAVIIIGMIPFERFIAVIKRLTYIVLVAIAVGTASSPTTWTNHVDDVTGERSIPGWHGTFDHKNSMMAFLLLGVITFWVFETVRWKRLLVTGCTIGLAVLGQSGTGSATLAVVSLAAISLRLRQDAATEKRGKVAVVATTLWITLALLVAVYGPSVVNFFGKDLTFTGRTTIWSATLRVIREQPWTGYGLGGVWSNIQLQPTAELNRMIGFRVGHAHSGVLELLVQLGIVGLVLFAGVAALAVSRLWRARFVAKRTARWGLLLCLVMLLLSLSEATTFHPGFTTLLFLFGVMAIENDDRPSRFDDPVDTRAVDRSTAPAVRAARSGSLG